MRGALQREGVKLASGSPKGAIRVLVGTWDRLRSDPAARLIEEGPAESGVYADFVPTSRQFSTSEGENRRLDLVALDQDGGEAENLGPDAGLIAATSRYGGPPVWIVTGGTEDAVRNAAAALDARHLRDHYAVAIEGGHVTPLPMGVR